MNSHSIQFSQDALVGVNTNSTSWAAHLALTQEASELLQGPAFFYAQRSEVGPQVDHSPRDQAGAPTGFDLQVAGLNPTLIASGSPATAPPWRLAGGGGTDQIEASLVDEEATQAGAQFGLHLDLDAAKAPALHDGDGFVDFGPAGGSYYYSRTRLDATGTLTWVHQLGSAADEEFVGSRSMAMTAAPV